MNKFNLYQGDCLEVLKTLPDASIDSIVTDPPYGLSKQPDIAEVLTKWLAGEDYTHRGSGFMGKSWDSFVPGPAVWRECFRVLKPGGHLIAFAGSRTYDLMAIAVRLGGFELRDQGFYIYGSGFPKSLDISKAVDKLDASEKRLERRYSFTHWFVDACPLTAREMDQVCQTNTMGRHWTDTKPTGKQPDVPTRKYFEMLRPHLTCSVPDWVEELINERTVESENFKSREVVGHDHRTANESWLGTQKGEKGFGIGKWDLTTAHTPAAKQWQGWGTALKPAHEPFVIARKPLEGTVANNVMKHGVGGLNIDGCRVGTSETLTGSRNPSANTGEIYGVDKGGEYRQHNQGRFPANLIHDNSEAVADILGDKARYFYGTKANKRDRNEGLEGFETASAGQCTDRVDGSAGLNSPRAGAGRTSGSKNIHPTVKPTDLMAYLCRLVTPPGGTVLDPFMGSGSTGKACGLEGFDFIGVEMDAEYLAIAEARISFAYNQQNQDLGGAA